MKKYIILDTETTGNQEEDKIVQLAFLVVDKNEKKAIESFCKPSVDIKFEAMAVHHIVPEMLVNKPEFNQCEATKILNELNNEENILIIQNAQFDLKMLEKEGFFWKGKLIDTLRCIKHLKKDLEKYSLQYLRYKLGFYKQEKKLADEFGVDIKAHDALGDVIVLYLLMQYLVNETKRDIQKLIELTNTPILYQKIPFGKYKNQDFESVTKSDSQYLKWMLNSMENLDEDIKYTINYYLQ